MQLKNYLLVGFFFGALFASFSANAGVVTDAHGNVGYDSAAECDAAVQSGTARFYQSFTRKPTLRRAGEAQVHGARLSDLGPDYTLGACDMGASHQFNRDGVSRVLQGKYVPFSPNTPINVYMNREGHPIRVTMNPCDNNFSGPRPRPVPVPVAAEPPQVQAPAPDVYAAPFIKDNLMRPYVFGTLGVLHDSVKMVSTNTPMPSAALGDAVTTVGTANRWVNDSSVNFAGQAGAGLQFNRWLGAEFFYQGGSRQTFNTADNLIPSVKVRNQTFGARMTLGGVIVNKTHLFGKIGIANVHHNYLDYSNKQTRFTSGVGLAYDLTNNLALRADYDHYFKRGSDTPKWKDADYFGLGLQYNF